MRRPLTVTALLVPLVIAGNVAVAASPGTPQMATGGRATVTQNQSATLERSVSTTNEARQQAAALNELLDRSALQRDRVATATGQIERCEGLSAARQDLLDAAAGRQSLVNELNQMDLSDLPDNQRLSVDLEDAWDASADSDRNYADWAQQSQATGCPPGGPAPRTAAHRAAQSTDQLASESKESFVELWNPIGSAYDLPERTAREI